MIETSQPESAEPVSPVSSEAFDQLLRRAAANSTALRGRPTPTRSTLESLGPSLIGETAGAVWNLLYDRGPTTFAALLEDVGAPESLSFMAVGWLARENKITIEPHDGDYEIHLK